LPLNTSDSVYRRDEPKGTVEPVPLDDVDPHVINTSALYDEMEATDEPTTVEVVGTLSSDNWAAVLRGEGGEYRTIPLVCWSHVRSDEVDLLFGIVPDGNVIDLTEDIGDDEAFRGYLKLSKDPTLLTSKAIEAELIKQTTKSKE